MIKKPDPNIAIDEDEKLEDREPSNDLETVVGPSVHVQGEFKSKGDIVVKGIVSGDVETKRSLTVESDAEVDADVVASEATISGQIKGSVSVSNKLDITETAHIDGDIECETLRVAPGAVIQGNISMSESSDTKGRRTQSSSSNSSSSSKSSSSNSSDSSSSSDEKDE
ncbi:MAG: polymer-forming cytoskeletal protein [Candidatus Magasanikbacteria bacterium]